MTPYQKEILFLEKARKMIELEKLGLPVTQLRLDLYWQGDTNTYTYSHLDIETIRKLSWIEFIEDNSIYKGLMGTQPNQYRKYEQTLSWEEIEAIKDITK